MLLQLQLFAAAASDRIDHHAYPLQLKSWFDFVSQPSVARNKSIHFSEHIYACYLV